MCSSQLPDYHLSAPRSQVPIHHPARDPALQCRSPVSVAPRQRFHSVSLAAPADPYSQLASVAPHQSTGWSAYSRPCTQYIDPAIWRIRSHNLNKRKLFLMISYSTSTTHGNPSNSFTDTTHQCVGNRPRTAGNFLDRQTGSPQHDVLTNRRLVAWLKPNTNQIH